MRPRLLILVVLIVCASLFGNVQKAGATKIAFTPWQQLALQADFVGIVECEIAGGNVAEYRVVEVWKGPQKVGDHVRIFVPPNYWGQQYQLALCSERYYVTVFKSAPPSNLISTTKGGPVPIWWRNLSVDYCTPLLQGWEKLSKDDPKVIEFDKFRKEAQALLALTPAEQEATLLRLMIEKHILPGDTDEAKPFQAMKNLVEKKAHTEDLVNELIRMAPLINSPGEPDRLSFYLCEVAGPSTLSLLEKIPARSAPWKNHDEVLRQLRVRLGVVKSDAPPRRELEAAPTEAALTEYRRTLAAGITADGFYRAFDVLTRYDSPAVVDFLKAWQNPTQQKASESYILGSSFAIQCGKDREKHLRELLAAKEPYIRTAAAVYLCYESEKEGIAALEKLTVLDGDPGVWAALTLARRGHKDVVPKLLETFRPLDFTNKTLRLRVLELLSNSAKRSNVPQPPGLTRRDTFENLTKWWEQHGDKIKLHDPWLEILAKQKVD